VGAGGEPLEQVQFWCWSDSGCVSRITFPFPLTLMLATASEQVCVPLGHSSLYFYFRGTKMSLINFFLETPVWYSAWIVWNESVVRYVAMQPLSSVNARCRHKKKQIYTNITTPSAHRVRSNRQELAHALYWTFIPKPALRFNYNPTMHRGMARLSWPDRTQRTYTCQWWK